MQVVSGEQQIHPVTIPPQAIQTLRALFSTYTLLKREVTREKNRIFALLTQNLYPCTKKAIFSQSSRERLPTLCPEGSDLTFQLSLLLEHLQQMETHLQALKDHITLESAPYAREIDILTSMRGVSTFIAAAVIADIIEVSRFPSSRHFASYLRSSPKVKGSNQSISRGATNTTGRKLAVSLLAQALIHFQRDPRLHAFQQRLSPYKKCGVVRMAMLRRAITQLYQMLKDWRVPLLPRPGEPPQEDG